MKHNPDNKTCHLIKFSGCKEVCGYGHYVCTCQPVDEKPKLISAPTVYMTPAGALLVTIKEYEDLKAQGLEMEVTNMPVGEKAETPPSKSAEWTDLALAIVNHHLDLSDDGREIMRSVRTLIQEAELREHALTRATAVIEIDEAYERGKYSWNFEHEASKPVEDWIERLKPQVTSSMKNETMNNFATEIVESYWKSIEPNIHTLIQEAEERGQEKERRICLPFHKNVNKQIAEAVTAERKRISDGVSTKAACWKCWSTLQSEACKSSAQAVMLEDALTIINSDTQHGE